MKFVGLGGAWISGKTAPDGTRVITIDVNADNLVTGTQNAIQYVDGQGNRMISMLQKGNEVRISRWYVERRSDDDSI